MKDTYDRFYEFHDKELHRIFAETDRELRQAMDAMHVLLAVIILWLFAPAVVALVGYAMERRKYPKLKSIAIKLTK